MKTKFPKETALAAARDVLKYLRPACEPDRIIVAGSLRRRKQEVGDVELVYIGRRENRQVPGDMFHRRDYDLSELAIAEMERNGLLERRESITGHTAFGNKNKLMRHVPSGVPVDLFSTIETSWWNYLVCRTGPKESNTAIAQRAKDKGWAWNPYGSGFTGPGGAAHAVTSEQDLFDFLGIPYREPWER